MRSKYALDEMEALIPLLNEALEAATFLRAEAFTQEFHGLEEDFLHEPRLRSALQDLASWN